MLSNEIERQLDKKVKSARSNRGGEYYDKYDETEQCPGPFAKFLETHDICAQYTMPRTPQQTGVAKRRNRTLMDMDRSMLSNSSLPLSSWMHALKTAMYLSNKVPSKQPQRLLLNCGQEETQFKEPACLGLPGERKNL